jgi:6,7-dimethyl-8-ribityllumazine synthase
MSRILIIEATFYHDIAKKLSDAAMATLTRANITYDRIQVPGCFEIPAALSMAVQSKSYDGYIALGCVIRGETSHYDYVCSESANGLSILARKHCLALGYGIITANTEEQAYARCHTDSQNVGTRAAATCLQMLEVKQKLANGSL